MWLRKLSTSMGCEQADFVQALKLALDDDSIAEKMSDMVTNKLKFDLNTLTDSNNELKREISKFSDLNKSLQKEVSDLREIVKRKDSEIISITRPTLERRTTLGHFRSIKPNMINHFAN